MEDGARKRNTPEINSTEVPEGSGWLTLEVPTPFKCEICSRAFASEHALGGYHNAHRRARIQEESSPHMEAQLRAMWYRQTLRLLRTVFPLRAVPITVVAPPPNPFFYQIQLPPTTTMVPDRRLEEARVEVPKPKGKGNEVREAKKRKVVHGYAPGASSFGPAGSSSEPETDLDLELKL